MQDLGGEALLFTQQSQQKMLGSNVLVRKALSLLGSISQNPLALVAQREIDRGQELLPDRGVSLNLLADGLHRSMRTQEPEGESFVFAQKSQQQVLRLYVRRTELTGLVARKEDDAPRFLRVPFKHEPSPRQVLRSAVGLVTSPIPGELFRPIHPLCNQDTNEPKFLRNSCS